MEENMIVTRDPKTLNLSPRLDLRSLNTYIALQNLSVYYTWKNMRKQYKNNKLKIAAPT